MDSHIHLRVIDILFLIAIAQASSLASNHQCRHVFRDLPGKMSGRFSSPPQNHSYSSNITSRYQFRASPGHVINLFWEKFELEEPMQGSEQCQRDYVLIIVIDNRNVQHASSRYCGFRLPPPYRTLQRGIDVVFKLSSDSQLLGGFSGRYQIVREGTIGAPKSFYPTTVENGCGGQIYSRTHGGVITNPRYPAGYAAPVECNWLIRVPNDKQILVKVMELSLTKTIDCDRASVSMIDGYAHYQPGKEDLPNHDRKQLCGRKSNYPNEGEKSYISRRNRLIIRFETKLQPPADLKESAALEDQPIGFYLVWTEVDKIGAPENTTDADHCDGFHCAGGAVCFNDTVTICASRPRYCIDRSLVCDRIPSCSEGDASDEENC